MEIGHACIVMFSSAIICTTYYYAIIKALKVYEKNEE